jgi:hypothetical protein
MADPIFKELAYAALEQTARNPTQDFLRATPRNPVLGYLADLAASTYAPQRTQQMQGIAQFFGAPAVSQTLDRLSYGEPLTTGAGGLGGTTRIRPEAIEAAMIAAPFVGKAAKATKGLPVGMSIKNVSPPQAEALRLAQQRAALPVEQGGLGLPANNTAAERAAAMGFDKDVFHGTNTLDIEKIDPTKARESVQYMPGFFTAENPQLAENFGEFVMPMMQKKGTTVLDKRAARIAGEDVPIVDTVYDKTKGILVTNNPDNVRSRFAAFDPFRKTAATAATMGVAAPDLLAQEQPLEMQLQAMMLRDIGTDLNTIYKQTGIWLGE